MSSILKALEKVEESQNPRRHGGAAGLARGRERRPAWLIPAWALGGAAVATLVTFAIMGGFSRSAAPIAQPVENNAVNSAPLAAAPMKPLSEPAAVPTVRLSETADREVSVPIPKAVPAPVPKPARLAAQPPARPATLQAAPAVAIHVPAAAAPEEVVPEKPRQQITVTGIAWQKESGSSFAMVNGRPVRQGGVVDGFKVEQIYEDSVRFSGSNGSVTVPLGAGEE